MIYYSENRKAVMKCSVERTLVCVEYPAVVENEDRMLQSLGGTHKISKVHFDRDLSASCTLRAQLLRRYLR